MCHYYRMKKSIDEVNKRFAVDWQHQMVPLSSDFFPLKEVPAVIAGEKSERELVPLEWGLLPFWWKPSEKSKSRASYQRRCFNARSETAHEKPTFRKPFVSKRCLLPATSFFEYGTWFHLEDEKLFAVAGLWDEWEGEDDQTVRSCTMLTTVANEKVGAVHPKNRMPIVLPDESAESRWLSPDTTEPSHVSELFVPFADAKLFASKEVKAKGDEI